MSLKRSYTLIAPFYDLVAGRAFERARRASLARLDALAPCDVLLDAIGTGLDLEWLPRQHRYVGLDLTRAMLERARPRGRGLDIEWTQGDSLALPCRDACFDHAVLHLIVAVVARPEAALAEAARVVKPGGTLLVLDKFLPEGRAAPLRRLLNPLARRIATRTDIVFESVLAGVPGLRVIENDAALARGWFRRIVLEKQ